MPPNLAVMVERLDNFMLATGKQHKVILDDVQSKHTQNRTDIHGLRNSVETVQLTVNKIEIEITTLKVKLAMYASIGGIGAGIITAVVTTVIQRFLFKS